MQFPTRYGKILDFGNPQPDQIDVKDITFSLAHICRFNGHSKKHYSVAQHSVLVAQRFNDPKLRLYALLHDAHEAYTGDITSPLKLYMNSISPGIVDKVEHKIDAAIHAHFGLQYPLSELAKTAIKLSDKRALATETRDLTRLSHEAALRRTWQFPEPFPEKIVQIGRAHV